MVFVDILQSILMIILVLVAGTVLLEALKDLGLDITKVDWKRCITKTHLFITKVTLAILRFFRKRIRSIINSFTFKD